MAVVFDPVARCDTLVNEEDLNGYHHVSSSPEDGVCELPNVCPGASHVGGQDPVIIAVVAAAPPDVGESRSAASFLPAGQTRTRHCDLPHTNTALQNKALRFSQIVYDHCIPLS